MKSFDRSAYTGHVGKLPIPSSDPFRACSSSEWIAEEFGASGAFVLLAADPGSGKTTLLYHLAHAVAKGEDFLGQLKTFQASVLVLQADEPRDTAYKKLTVMGLDEPDPNVRYLFADDFHSSANPMSIEVLDALYQAKPFKLLIADSLTSIFAGGERAMREPEFAKPLYDLNEWCGSHGVLLVMTCHLRKPSEGSQRTGISQHDLMGTGMLSAAVSDTWALSQPAGFENSDKFLFQCLGKRNCQKGTKWILQGSLEDYSWELLDVSANDLLPSQKRELSEQILELLESHPSGLSISVIASQTGSNNEHCRRVCKDLFIGKKLGRSKASEASTGRPKWLYKSFPTSPVSVEEEDLF